MTQIQTREATFQVYNERRPSLLVSALSSWVALLVNVIVGLLLTPYIISHINKDGYGIWTLVASFIGYFGLLRLGVGSAVMRYLPLYEGRNDRQKLNGIFSTALSIYLVVALLIFTASFLGAGLIANFFNEGSKFKLLVRLIGIAAAITCPSAIIDATIRAREKFVVANLLAIATSVVRALALVAVLYLGYGLTGMGWVTVALSFIGLLLSTAVLIKVCPDIRFSLNTAKSSHLSALLSFGIMANLMGLGFMLRFQSDRVIIGKFMDMKTLGIYAVAATLMFYYRSCIGATGRVLMPRFGYLDGKGFRTETVNLFMKSTKVMAVVAVGVAGMLIAVGPSFIKLWVGKGFEAAYPVLFLLALAQIVDQSQTPSIALLAGLGKQGVLAAFAIIEGIAAVILSVILIQKYALMGVAVGLAIPMVVTQALIRPIYVCRFLSVGLVGYYKKCLLKSWLLVVVLFLPIRFIRFEEWIDSWLSFISIAIILGSVYLAASYFLVFNRNERLFLSQRLCRVIPVVSFVAKKFRSRTAL